MKEKSFFSQIVFLIILAFVCFLITIGLAVFAGSYSTTLFNFSNFNFVNMIPILLIGMFISCIVIGIAVLYASKSVFTKITEYFKDNKIGGNEK